MNTVYTVVIEKSEAGYYAEVPAISGVYAQGETESEVLANVKDVLELTLEDMKARGEIVEDSVSVPQISFSAVAVGA